MRMCGKGFCPPIRNRVTSSPPLRAVVLKDNLFYDGVEGSIPDQGEGQILGWVCLIIVPIFSNPEKKILL